MKIIELTLSEKKNLLAKRLLSAGADHNKRQLLSNNIGLTITTVILSPVKIRLVSLQYSKV